MKTKHTRGPWKLEWHHDRVEIYNSTDRTHYYVLILRHGSLIPSINDAKLIASAPDLLATLKKLLYYCQNGESRDGELSGFMMHADRVIKKAEGRIK